MLANPANKWISSAGVAANIFRNNFQRYAPGRLQYLGIRSKKFSETEQISPTLPYQYRDIEQEDGETAAEQRILQPIILKYDRLLEQSWRRS